ncbi:MAG: cysteine--tRNA ligase [Minisyncoccia bacterium]
MLRLYNTLTKKIEVFKPLKDKKVGLYTCGPTVYDYDHLGHAWNYTMADLLRRTLEYLGYKVKHVMNITDVGHLTSDSDTGEDKIEKSAKEHKKTAWEIAEYFTKIYLQNRKKLNLLEPHIICKATEHIKEMINLIEKIFKKGAAYIIDDGVYFDISKYPKYGQLSGNTLENLKTGARIEINPQKKHPADFALWKFTPKGVKRQMEWDSPWGKGFPGWHIECSAMSMKYLGETFDIHTGGEDNIFPHHESEIAQAETATGKKFVRYWFHPRFLMVEGQKMSKSLKNFYTLKDLEDQGFAPLALRFLFLSGHYRARFNFTFKGLEAAQNSLNNLYNFIEELLTTKSAPKPGVSLTKSLTKYDKEFLKAIKNDLNIPKALAVLYKLIKDYNKNKNRPNQRFHPKRVYALIIKWDKIFGLNLKEIKPAVIPQKIKKLAQKREKYRKEKNYKKADELRKKIEKLGYLIEDTPTGPKIKNMNDKRMMKR